MLARYIKSSRRKKAFKRRIFSIFSKQVSSILDSVRHSTKTIFAKDTKFSWKELSFETIKKQSYKILKETNSFSKVAFKKLKNLKKQDIENLFTKKSFENLYNFIYKIETKQKIIFSVSLIFVAGIFSIIRHNQNTMVPDAVFRRSVLSSWDYTSERNSAGIRTRLKKEKTALAVLVERENSQIEFKLPINNPSLKVKGNTATYTNKDKSIEVKYEIFPNKLKESIILNSPTTNSEFISSFLVQNLIIKINNENIPVFFDTENNYQFHLERPYATDDSGNTTFDLVYELRPKSTKIKNNPFKKKPYVAGENLLEMDALSEIQVNTNEYELVVSVNPEWLLSPDRQYPIIIDPTVVHDTTAEFAVGEFNRLIDSGSGSDPILETYYQESSADKNTIGLWHLNEASGNAIDSSDNGNTGTVNGTTVVSGLLNNARSFNGSSDYINANLGTYFGSNNPLTAESWIYVTSATNGPIFGITSVPPGGGWNMPFLSIQNNTLIGWIYNNSQITSSINNGWHHVAITYNPAGIGTHILYIDGNNVGEATGQYSPAGAAVYWSTYISGGKPASVNSYFNGIIDEVKASSIVRTPEEIKAAAARRPYSTYTSGVVDLYSVITWDSFTWTESGVATGDGETLFSSTDLVAQWNFNETSGTTADNAEGTSALDGTLSGFDSTASQDADPDSGWTANNRRWGSGGLIFDGVDSYVVTNNAVDFAPTTSSPFTIETWVKTNIVAGTGHAFIQGNDGTGTGRTLLGQTIANKFYTNIGGTQLESNTLIEPGKWYYFVVTYSGTGETLYINGKQETSAANVYENNVGTIIFGSFKGYASGLFNGILDSTRFYTRELSAAEILSNYNSSNIEFQTRVGAGTSPDDGSWDAWINSSETTIDNMDSFSPSSCTATNGTSIDDGRAFMFTKTDRAVYQFSGTDQTYTVPPGVTAIDIKMWGGGGGGGNLGGWTYGYAGGGGGYTSGTLAVTAGQVLTVMVGAGGSNGSIANTNPSYGGGARSCNATDCRYGGQGGGRSSIRTGSSDIITAGGGGGGGSSIPATGQQGGGGGGNSGVIGSGSPGGGGGTQVAGGAGGTGGSANGSPGTQYAGGNPASNAYGGGGGGGYYGGGGGGYTGSNYMGGGGGGSGYIGGAGGVTVSSGVTTAASGVTPGNSSDLDNARTGTGGAAATNGIPGRVIITPQYNMEFECTSSGEVEVLVVAGGGGGGMDMGGGGGGGGVIHNKSYSVTADTAVSVTVGAGGIGGPAAKSYGQPDYHQFAMPATNGNNSVFGTLTAVGGGKGGSSYYGHVLAGTPGNGGSGGGASGYSDTNTKAGGTGTAGQGFAGGQGGGQHYSGGGGGAGGVGTSSTSIAHGGVGYYSDILGPGYYWGGGGGGAGYTICGGNGGAGGAGGGGTCTTNGGSGLNNGSPGGGGTVVSQTNRAGGDAGVNTGGGGGGSSHYNVDNKGGEGGSGIVIVRLSPASKDTVIKKEGTGSQKFSPKSLMIDKDVVGLWSFEETGGTGAYIKDSRGFKTSIYSYTGSDQTFVVPTGITSIDVKMWGGGGGGGNLGGWTYGYEGGNGGYTTGTLAVTPAESLTVMVGAGGLNGSTANTLPSYGGGARSCNTGTDCRYGGQGGGRSAIRISSSDIITAGGGGGGGSSIPSTAEEGGSGGGWSGVDGTCATTYPNNCGGGGGTETAGGAGGIGVSANGSPGTQYAGGNPASNSYGGGGGGGYYGGGGGGYSGSLDMGGGGGGSGYIGGNGGVTVSSGTLSAGSSINGIGVGGAASTNGSNGRIEITWNTSDGNHATPTGTTSINGISGKARSFNGSSDFVLIPSTAELDNQNLTIEAWVYSDDYVQNGFIFEKTTNGLVNTQYSCFLADTDLFYFRTYNTTPTADNLSFTTSSYFTNGQWHHVACTYDGVNKKVFIDGIQVATKAYTQTLQKNPAGTAIIGAYGSGTEYWFNGKIDEVRVSSVGRTPEEINESYRLNRDKYLNNIIISSTNLSSKTSLPFSIAADRPGTYLNIIAGESKYANYQTDSNTAGLWHLNEKSGSGTYIKDDSDNNNHGTPTGTTYTEGKIGKGRTFNGTSDFIDTSNNSSLPQSGDITIDSWFKTSATGVFTTIVNHGATSDWLYVMGKDASDKFICKFYQTGSGTDYLQISSTENVNDGRWHHGACVLSGTTLSAYVDGQLSNVDSSTTGTRDTSTAGNLYIGKFNWSTTSNWDGSIDEVRVSNIARSNSEIRQAYEVGLRTHSITIDFAASGDSGNLITGSGDTSFTIDATAHGLNSMGSGLYKGDKIIVHENYDGTEYIAQGTVTSVTLSTGAVVVGSWDTGSTFPSAGYTANANFFKWQEEQWPISNNVLSSYMDGITNITLQQTNGYEDRTIWIDELRSNSNYLTTPLGSIIASLTGKQFFQYRSVFTSTDPFVSATLSSVSFATTSGPSPTPTPTPTPTPIPMDILNGESNGANSCYLEESPQDNQVIIHWTDGATDEIGYEIERQTNGIWKTIDITSPNAESYSDNSVSSGNIYRYKIRKRTDDGGTGEWCGTPQISLKTGNSQLEGLQLEGIKLD